MKLLILGGSHLIGRHIAEIALAAGHEVSTLNRGVTLDELPATVERLRGDRDLGAAGLSALDGRSWDACVDVSGYTAVQVRASAEKLRHRVERYLYISAVKAYGDPEAHPVHEGFPLEKPVAEDVTEVNGETYGPLKALCEGIVEEVFPGRFTILRPQVAVGPYDRSGRYAYWLRRARESGEGAAPMLAPGDGTDHLQLIDARDMARFAKTALENSVNGIFNMAGPRFTWSDFMTMIGAKNITWVPAAVLSGAGLTFSELPLYRPANESNGPFGCASLMDVSNARALEAGLTLTAPEASVRDMLAWMDTRPATEFPPMLPPELEAELVRKAAAVSL